VCDSGIGISASAQQRLFVPFSQAHSHSKFGGTGLGLAISKSLVELLGGSIGLDSKTGEGATFHFQFNVQGVPLEEVQPQETLPPHLRCSVQHRRALARQDTPSTVSAPSLSPSSPPPRARVLLLHRNPVVSSLLRTMLEEWNMDVVSCASFAALAAEDSPWRNGESDVGNHASSYHSIWFDVASVWAAEEAHLLPSLFQSTRAARTTVIAFLPLGSTRRSLEGMTDCIVTQPVKMANCFAAACIRHNSARAEEHGGNTGTNVASSSRRTSKDPKDLLGVAVMANGNGAPSKALVCTPTPLALSPQSARVAQAAAVNGMVVSSPSVSVSPSGSAFTPGPGSDAPSSVLPFPLATLSAFAASHPLRILIAEDNSINQRLISKMLSRLGYPPGQFRLTGDGQSCAEELQRANTFVQTDRETDTGTSGGGGPARTPTNDSDSDARRALSSGTGVGSDGRASASASASSSASFQPYHLVLMDLQMPIADGFVATSLIRQLPSIYPPFICALTANAMEGDAEHCIAQGMNHYMSKPLQVQVLAQALAKAFQARQHTDNIRAQGNAGRQNSSG
jgi:CheY-like chemotaxis protein